MAATRPSAVRTGSPDSSGWWETKEFTDLIQAARARRAAEDFTGLESVYLRGYQRAIALGNRPAQINYLINLGSMRMLSLRYASTLEAYLEASALAEQSADWFALGAIAVNLSLVYQRIGDANAALSALERGKTALDHLAGRVPPYYKAQLLMSLRKVRAALQDSSTERDSLDPKYEDAIEAARQAGDPDTEASAWDCLGAEKIAAGELEQAEVPLGQALRLRASHSPQNLGFSYAALGALRLAQANRASGAERRGRAEDAEILTNRAIAASPSSPALYLLLHQRGRIREVLGRTELALEDLGNAVDQVSQWSGAIPAALSLVTGANVAMQREVFDSFVEAAAREALRSGSQFWGTGAFLAMETNRAASLRQSRELAPVWKKKLPLAYWETLERVNRQEARDLRTSHTLGPESKRLRLELTEMESTAGGGVSVMLGENFRTRNSLSHFQQGLGQSELLLSFYLGQQESYLWAVTQRSIELHRLPAESEIREAVSRFQAASRDGQPAGDILGANLYRQLFGSLAAAAEAKTSWLLSLDGVLFDLPFAALVCGHQSGHPVYLTERHSSQRIPGALFLTAPLSSATGVAGGYLGVGDPVYNSADPRWKQGGKQGWRPGSEMGWRPRPPPIHPEHDWEYGGELNRLVNTGGELRRSAQYWRADAGQPRPIQILEGPAARRDAFLAALGAAPSIIHLATHVLAPTTKSDQVFLAFSLDSGGRPALLSTSEIGMLHVPGALVVMTGCATGTGDVRAGTGLLGLTRAWMMAGARAVVATNWPVPDSDGDLIPAFYRYLRNSSTAEALRRANVEMIHSGTWQASPSYWASFQVMGGGR